MNSSEKSPLEKIREQQRRADSFIIEAVRAHTEAEQRRRRIVRNLLLFLLATLTLYFVSLAFTDRSNFQDGIKILWRGYRELFICVGALGLAFWIYARNESSKQIMESAGAFLLIIGLLIIAVFIRGAIGLFSGVDAQSPHSRAIWTNGFFLFTLAAELVAGFVFYKTRARLKEKIEKGETNFAHVRLIVYFLEGLVFYSFMALLFQALFYIDVPTIVKIVCADPKKLLIFLFPLFGYVFIRKFLEGE